MSKKKKVEQNKVDSRIGIAIVVVVGLVAVVLAVPQLGGTGTAALAGEVSVAEAVTMRDDGAFILDVREPEEWAEFHIPSAVLIPLGELSARIDEVPRDRDVVVVCRSGNRSASGRDILLDAGYTRVTSMAGGVTQWRTSGYEIETN